MEFRFKSIVLQALVLGIAVILGLSSCRNEEFNESPDVILSFSTDSIKFDTVFATVGSATQLLKVYNTDDSFVRISEISLLNDPNNSYRLNVDGISGTEFESTEIAPNDSLFIFVEVTVQPDANQLYPFVEGIIQFNINGNIQEVDLVAWGWDAIFYVPTVFPTNGLPDFTLIDNDNPTATVTWSNEKPIVVYGYLVVDSLQSLVIEPGTEVFFHAGAGLWIYRDGNLKAEGTLEEPIVFQGDRLESFYDEQPGQWDRIWINEGANDNVLRHCIIKNNFIGIQAETIPFAYNIEAGLADNKLILENVAIRNNSIAGLFTRNYRVDANNLLLSSGGQYLLAGTGGGEYNFDQCTFANNWRFGIRTTPAVFLTNVFQIDASTIAINDIESSRFRNCIIYGNSFNEFGLDFEMASGIDVDLQFQNCLFKSEEEVIQEYIDEGYLAGTNYVNQEPGFVDFSSGDFRLIETAFVRSIGLNSSSLPEFDIVGTPYNSPPPIGCFEFLPE